jgi:hypothetical protein
VQQVSRRPNGRPNPSAGARVAGGRIGYMLPRRVKRRAFRAVAAARAPPLAADAFDPPLTARKSNARRFAAFFSPLHSVERLLRGCAVTRRRFPVGASPTRQPLQPEATGAGMEATKCLKPSDSGSRSGDRASVQAATRMNAEHASKRSMCRPTRRPLPGKADTVG